MGPQDHAAGPESLDTGGAHASAVGHHGPTVARRDEAARPCELRVVRYASAVTVEARPMSRDPLQRRQLVRPLAALPPRYGVQDLRIPRACSRQCCRQAPQRRLSHSRRALVAASLAYRRHLVRGYPWSRKRAPSPALRFRPPQCMKSSSGPPSHSPRRATSCTRHGSPHDPVNRTFQGVVTGVRCGDRGTGAAGPAWLVVREPRGRPAEAIRRTRRPRSRTRRRPMALFWVARDDAAGLSRAPVHWGGVLLPGTELLTGR